MGTLNQTRANSARAYFCIFAVAMLSACTATYTPTFTHTDSASIDFLSQTPQEELDVQFNVANSAAAAGAQAGALGALIGSIVDASVNHARAKKAERQAEVLRTMLVNVRFQGLVEDAIASRPLNEQWSIATISAVDGEAKISDAVKDKFQSSDADVVIVLQNRFSVTTSLTGLEVDTLATIYKRAEQPTSGRAKRSAIRSFQYRSEQYGEGIRAWKSEAEKEAYIATINKEYEERLATTPPDAQAELQEDLDKEIKSLAKSKKIPADLALKNTWTREILVSEISRGVDQIAYLLNLDLTTRAAVEGPDRTAERIDGVLPSGQIAKLKGQYLEDYDGSRIFRTDAGNLIAQSL